MLRNTKQHNYITSILFICKAYYINKFRYYNIYFLYSNCKIKKQNANLF